MDIYSGQLKGGSATAASDSPPGSGHSAVALETGTGTPEWGEPQYRLSRCVGGAEAAGADLHCDQLRV